jgi:hypothetical protein
MDKNKNPWKSFGGQQARRRAPQPIELGQGGVRFVRQGDRTVALPCEKDGEMLGTQTAVTISYKIASTELSLVRSFVNQGRGKTNGPELLRQFADSPLARVADQGDWDDWAKDFCPTNRQRGRPKGVALTFLERKMGLDRTTIKGYLSRSKKIPK